MSKILYVVNRLLRAVQLVFAGENDSKTLRSFTSPDI